MQSLESRDIIVHSLFPVEKLILKLKYPANSIFIHNFGPDSFILLEINRLQPTAQSSNGPPKKHEESTCSTLPIPYCMSDNLCREIKIIHTYKPLISNIRYHLQTLSTFNSNIH